MRPNKRVIVTIAGLLLAGAAMAQRGDDADRPSKNGRAEGEVGGVGVVVEYGMPNAKGRDLWGALVPYEKVWRTGANEATTITLAADATIEGESIPAGTYALFTIPGEGEWTLILNKTAEQWGAFDYDEGEDALRVMVETGSGDFVESMDFVVGADEVVLRWGEVTVPFAVAAD